MIDYEIEDLIDSVYNPRGNTDSLPNVTLENIEVEFLKGLAKGKNLKEINNIIASHSKAETFHSISMKILEKLEAFTIPHAVLKVLKMNIINFSD